MKPIPYFQQPGTCLLLALLIYPCYAEVTLDGSLGGSVRALPGPDYAIQADMGMQRGGNLFHSFGDFNLSAAESATFNDGGVIAPVENILSRVTGGRPSNIDGRISTRFADSEPNLFFMNPAGVVFGPNASLDVQGSFHVTTANYLKLGNGDMFHADLNEKTTLSVASVSAFGFTDVPVGDITINQSRLEEETLSVIGGDITIKSGQLLSQSGRIDLVSVGSEGEIQTATPQDLEAFDQLGQIAITSIPRSEISIIAVNEGGEGIFVSGHQLNLSKGSRIITFTSNVPGSDILIKVNDIFISGVNIAVLSRLSTRTSGDSNAGDISVVAENVALLGFGVITSNGGNISIHASNAIELTASSNAITTSPFRSAASGDIEMFADSLVMVNRDPELISALFTSTSVDANAGDIRLNIKDAILLFGNVGIFSSTHSLPGNSELNELNKGSAGDIIIDANELVVANRASIDTSSTASEGNAGQIHIQAKDSISMLMEGQIHSMTTGDGDAGDLILEARTLDLSDQAKILSSSENSDSLGNQNIGMGSAGQVHIKTEDSVTLMSGSQIGSATTSDGRAGNVTIETNRLNLDGSRGIFSNSGLNRGDSGLSVGKGDAGQIHVKANDSVTMLGGQISSSTAGDGEAGNVILDTGILTLSDQASISSNSGGSDNTGKVVGKGSAGQVLIKASDLVTMTSGSRISSSTVGDGRAGEVVLNTKTLDLSDQASIFSDSGLQSRDGIFFVGKGAAGRIHVKASESIIMTSGSQIASSTGGDGRAGDVTIETNWLKLDGSQGIVSNSGVQDLETGRISVGMGAAGQVHIQARDSVIMTSGSQISSSTAGDGEAGEVTLETRALDLSEQASIISASGLQNQDGRFSVGTGSAGQIDIKASDLLIMTSDSQVSSSTAGDGKAGDVTIKTNQLQLDGARGIFSSSGTENQAGNVLVGTGAAGRIHIKDSDSISISRSAISSTTSGDGEAGDVIVDTRTLYLSDQGSIFSDSGSFDSMDKLVVGEGSAGRILITAEDSLIMTSKSQIASSTAGTGLGGSLVIKANQIEINEKSRISATSTTEGLNNNLDKGKSGDISITTNDFLRLTSNGQITAETAQANAGDINLNVGHLLQLNDNSAITTSAAVVDDQGTGDGGNINITADTKPAFTILDDTSQIIAQAQQGKGGKINIDANTVLFRAPGSVISASSQSGETGTVTIDSPDTNLIDSALILPGSFLDASALLSQRCADRGGKSTGSFIIKPLDGIQPTPEDYLSGFYTVTTTPTPANAHYKPFLPLDRAMNHPQDSLSSGCTWY